MTQPPGPLMILLSHLEVVYHSDVFGGSGALGVVHYGVSLHTGDAAGRQHFIVLIHTQRLPAQVLHW